jgi:hypothetical protein
MRSAGNPLGDDYRSPSHVERHEQLIIFNPSGEIEGKHPLDVDHAVMPEVHQPMPILRVIREKCLDCCAGSESEVRKCGAIKCALWPYRMASNPFRRREMTDDQREAAGKRLAAVRAGRRSASEQAAPGGEPLNFRGKNQGDENSATHVLTTEPA